MDSCFLSKRMVMATELKPGVGLQFLLDREIEYNTLKSYVTF